MSSKKWAERTVKHGRVRIFGHDYAPDERHMKYDGRLDNLRLLFGRYIDGPDDFKPFVYMWGTEEEVRSLAAELDTVPYIVNGTIPWAFWHLVD